MIGTFVSYLVVYLLGALSLYLYQLFFPKKAGTYVPRPLPTFNTTPSLKASNSNLKTSATSTPPAKIEKDDKNVKQDGVAIATPGNSKVLVPLDGSTQKDNGDNTISDKTEGKDDKEKSSDDNDKKAKTTDDIPQEKGKEKDDVRAALAMRHSKKSATMREARRFAKSPVAGDGIVIGATHKRGSMDGGGSAPPPAVVGSKGSGIHTMPRKDLLSQSTPNLKNSPLTISADKLPNTPQVNPMSHSSPKTSRDKKISKEQAKQRVMNLRSFNPSKERLVEYKRGWMDIRSLKKFNRRYFILYSGFDGNWLSYFKDEKMKRAECYGHVVLTGACTIRKKNDSECAFVIHHTSKVSIFSSKGPYGLIASSSHRMFHGKSPKCVLRADDPEVASIWMKKLEALCSDTPVAAPGLSLLSSSGPRDESEEETADSDHSDLAGSGHGWDNSRKAFATSHEAEREEVEDGGEGEEGEEGGEENDKPLEEEDGDGEKFGDSDRSDSDHEAASEPVYYPYEWPEEEKTAIMSLQNHAKDLLEQNGCLRDEYFLWRFLKARAFNVEATQLMLENYFRWRTTFCPEQITIEDVMDEVVKKKIHFNGYDNYNRPILMVYAANHNPKESSLEMLVKFACFIIETAVKKMTLPVQTYSLIVDMTNFGYSNVDYAVAKEAAALFQDVYPERLGVLMCVNCPFIVNAVWHVIKPMLDDRTKKKVNFLKNGKELIKTGIFPLQWIPKSLGGECEYVCPTGSIGLETLE